MKRPLLFLAIFLISYALGDKCHIIDDWKMCQIIDNFPGKPLAPQGSSL